MLSQEQLSQFKAQLTEWKRELAHRLKHNEHFGMEYEMRESTQELSLYDNHPGDTGTEEFERSKDLALNEHAEKELEDVENALKRIEEGTYGICEVCHEEIPLERLEALPSTTRCIKHASEDSVSENRPVEEEVLDPPFGQFEYDEGDQISFDAEDSWQSVAAYGTSETPSDFFDVAKLSYDDMFIEGEEPVGYVDKVEGFIITDMEGNYIGVSEEHNDYEEFLDDHRITSIFGDHGIDGVDYLGGEEL